MVWKHEGHIRSLVSGLMVAQGIFVIVHSALDPNHQMSRRSMLFIKHAIYLGIISSRSTANTQGNSKTKTQPSPSTPSPMYPKQALVMLSPCSND